MDGLLTIFMIAFIIHILVNAKEFDVFYSDEFPMLYEEAKQAEENLVEAPLSTRPAHFDPQELVEHICNTCKSIQEGLDEIYNGMEEDDLLPDDLTHIDNEIFRCGTCDWWHELCEESEEEDGTCKDCIET